MKTQRDTGSCCFWFLKIGLTQTGVKADVTTLFRQGRDVTGACEAWGGGALARARARARARTWKPMHAFLFPLVESSMADITDCTTFKIKIERN